MKSVHRLTLISILLATYPVVAENWPHWRGPRLDGTSLETGLPTIWSSGSDGGKNIAWRYELPGPGPSSPIVWGDRIYVTSTERDSNDLVLLALSREGELVWRVGVDRGSVKVVSQFAHETNAAASSPVTDGEHVYALFGTARIYSVARTGEIVWSADLGKRYGDPNTYFGISTTPLLLGDRLYLHLLHSDAQLVLALDRKTGEEVWRHERTTDARAECLHSYTSLMPFSPAGRQSELLLVHGADYITAHEPTDGSEAWRFGTLNPKKNYNSAFRLVSSPVTHDGLVVVPTAKRGPVFGLRPGDSKGLLGASQLAWKLDKGTPDVPSPVIAGGLVYLSGENGRLTVLDAQTGETIYAERVHRSQHRASPVFADGKLYLTATDGTVSVVRAGRTYELLAKNQVEGGRLSATPAISEGTIYLRNYDALYAIAE